MPIFLILTFKRACLGHVPVVRPSRVYFVLGDDYFGAFLGVDCFGVYMEGCKKEREESLPSFGRIFLSDDFFLGFLTFKLLTWDTPEDLGEMALIILFLVTVL